MIPTEIHQLGFLNHCSESAHLSFCMLTVLQAQRAAARPSFHDEFVYEESLPSYTIVTGLPSYDQAMEQFRQLRAIRRMSSPKLTDANAMDDLPPRITFARLSLGEIFQFYKVDKNLPV